MESRTKIIEMRSICKSFGAVQALNDVDFELYKGEVLALLGDNGAGKSTLIKILSGVYTCDTGEMRVYGEPVAFKTPQDARNTGIETIYQDLALFDNLNLTANIFAGREVVGRGISRWLGFVDKRRMQQDAKRMLDQLEINIGDYSADVKSFSGGQRQSIAIAKSIYWGHKIIIMDEPTAALGVRETEGLFKLIRDLKQHGIPLIVVMHNIEQVLRIAERAIVLRHGRRVGEIDLQQDTATAHEMVVKLLI